MTGSNAAATNHLQRRRGLESVQVLHQPLCPPQHRHLRWNGHAQAGLRQKRRTDRARQHPVGRPEVWRQRRRHPLSTVPVRLHRTPSPDFGRGTAFGPQRRQGRLGGGPVPRRRQDRLRQPLDQLFGPLDLHLPPTARPGGAARYSARSRRRSRAGCALPEACATRATTPPSMVRTSI